MTVNINKEYLITQQTFRVLLQAMSRPGRVYQLEQKTEARSLPPNASIGGHITDKYNPSSVFCSLFSVLQTLLDHEVAFSVVGYAQDSLEAEIIRLTGSYSAAIEDADFVIVLPSGDSGAALLRAKRGNLEYPDGGATVIYLVHSLANGNNRKSPAVLKGPGIDGEISPFIGGLGRNEFSYLKEINSEYPIGVDCIFVDSTGQVMCIPRSTRILLK